MTGWYAGLRNLSDKYLHVINYAMMFLPIDNHIPRHESYSHWVNDPDMYGYLSGQNRLMFFAPHAVSASDQTFANICRLHLEKDVVMVDPGGDKGLFLIPALETVLKRGNQPEGQWDYVGGVISDGSGNSDIKFQDQMIFDSFHLPSGFSPYLATGVLGDARPLRFLMQLSDGKLHEFEPAQGELVRPYTFDVQNIREGWVNFALPADEYLPNRKYVLLFPGERAKA